MGSLYPILFVFSITLFCSSLLADFAGRTLFSTSILFLAVGIGVSGLGLVNLREDLSLLRGLADWALLTVLFTDGMEVNFKELKKSWRLPVGALLFGMPLTIIFISVIIRVSLNLSWTECILAGAILSPTDPVFASHLVGSEGIPKRLRHLLNLESGLNDGIALPIVLILLSHLTGGSEGVLTSVKDVAMGIVVGTSVTIGCLWILKRFRFKIDPLYGPLFTLAVFLMVFSLANFFHANKFLAAFSSGALISALKNDLGKVFEPLGAPLVEMLKLASVLCFGMMVSFTFLREVPVSLYLVPFLILFLARPVAICLSLWKSRLSLTEKAAAAWFGPRGFASVVFSLQLLKSPLQNTELIFHLLAITIALSIILHSSTDVPLARWVESKAP